MKQERLHELLDRRAKAAVQDITRVWKEKGTHQKLLISIPTDTFQIQIIENLLSKREGGFLVLTDDDKELEKLKKHFIEDFGSERMEFIHTDVDKADGLYPEDYSVIIVLNADQKVEKVKKFLDKIFPYSDECSVIGISPIPWTLAGETEKIFGEVAHFYSLSAAGDDQILPKINLRFFPVKINIPAQGKGEIDQIAYFLELQKQADKIAEKAVDIVGERSTVVYLPQTMGKQGIIPIYMNAFTNRGLRCGFLDASVTGKKREKVIEDFENGTINFLFTLDVLISGKARIKSAECVFMIRPTESPRVLIRSMESALSINSDINEVEYYDLLEIGEEMEDCYMDGYLLLERELRDIKSEEYKTEKQIMDEKLKQTGFLNPKSVSEIKARKSYQSSFVYRLKEKSHKKNSSMDIGLPRAFRAFMQATGTSLETINRAGFHSEEPMGPKQKKRIENSPFCQDEEGNLRLEHLDELRVAHAREIIRVIKYREKKQEEKGIRLAKLPSLLSLDKNGIPDFVKPDLSAQEAKILMDYLFSKNHVQGTVWNIDKYLQSKEKAVGNYFRIWQKESYFELNDVQKKLARNLYLKIIEILNKDAKNNALDPREETIMKIPLPDEKEMECYTVEDLKAANEVLSDCVFFLEGDRQLGIGKFKKGSQKGEITVSFGIKKENA